MHDDQTVNFCFLQLSIQELMMEGGAAAVCWAVKTEATEMAGGRGGLEEDPQFFSLLPLLASPALIAARILCALLLATRYSKLWQRAPSIWLGFRPSGQGNVGKPQHQIRSFARGFWGWLWQFARLPASETPTASVGNTDRGTNQTVTPERRFGGILFPELRGRNHRL